jgi:flagellar protein FlaG
MKIDSVVPNNTAGMANGSAAPVARQPQSTVAEGAAGATPNAIQRNESSQPAQERSLNVDEAAQRLNRFVASVRPEINFTVDETSGVRVVRVVDSSTQEVIRQIPSEEVIRMAQVLDKLQGLFVKEAV